MDRTLKVWLVLAILIAALLTGFCKVNGLRAELIQRENFISAKYQTNQAMLSSYVLGYQESLTIADRSSEKLNTILLNAIHGHYDKRTEPNGALFSAIKEAYPDIDLNGYNRILDFIASRREQFRAEQTELQDMIRNYDSLRTSDLIDNFLADLLGFPSLHLNATIGEEQLTGSAALERVKRVVTDDLTLQSFRSGQMQPLFAPAIH